MKAFRLKSLLPEGMSFPSDFGFIPSTLCNDGDPLDVMILVGGDVCRRGGRRAADRRPTAQIVIAFVRNNKVAAAALPTLIGDVHLALQQASNGRNLEEPPLTASAAKIRASVKPHALISFIDGKPYTMLRRHLTRHGLTPAEYLERYGLPEKYPMVAAKYAARRSELAKSMGLGRYGGAARAKNHSA
jgi:predicted transcriptional regulator